MERITYNIQIKLKSAVNISSGETRSGNVSIMMKDIYGYPLIPATTIKGIIKSNYIYLHNLYHKVSNCDCEACRIFGSSENISSLVLFEDLKPKDRNYFVNFRMGTAIDRYRRAVFQSLFSQETVESATFCGKVVLFLNKTLIDSNVKKKFEMATRFIQKIGSGKSRGLGEVEVTLEEV